MEATLIVQNNLDYLPICQSFITSILEKTSFEKKFAKKIILVVEEAFCHLIDTAYEQGETGEIKIKATIFDTLEISFFDKGLPFEPSIVNEYNPKENPFLKFDTKSFGIFLIKEIADKVQWINLGRNGKELKIIFNLPEKDITETLNKSDLTPYTEDVTKQENVSYDIHKIRENEYVKVARCIYKTYGYSYPNEDLYFPERIKRHNENGTLISVIATENDEVVGHYALERYDLGKIAESGQAVVIPKHRGHNLLDKMRSYLEDEAVKLKLHGIYSQPVTNHTLSQQVNRNYNSKPFGLTLGLVPKSLSFKKSKTAVRFEERISCMYYYKALMSPGKKIFYIPEKYEKIISAIYSNANFPTPQIINKSEIQSESGIVEYNFYPVWNFGVIKVKKTGKDNFNVIKQAFFSLLKSGAEMIYLELPVEQTGCDNVINDSNNFGFIFSGVAPSALDGKDVFRMQFINADLDISKLKILGEDADIIYDFIREELCK